MIKPNEYTPDLLPEDRLPPEIADGDLYKPAGYGCRDCMFVTKKKGFPGKQALRAHRKKHKSDRRAWLHPFIKQSLVVAVLVGVVILGVFDLGIRDQIPFALPTVTLPNIATWPIVGAIGVLIVVSTYFVLFADDYTKRLVRILDVCKWLGTLTVALSVTLAWGVIDLERAWVVHAAVWVMMAPTPGLAAIIGVARLSLRRRRQKPGNYAPLVQPKDENAGIQADRLWKQRARVVGVAQKCPKCNGQFPPSTPPGRVKCGRCGTVSEFKAEVAA